MNDIVSKKYLLYYMDEIIGDGIKAPFARIGGKSLLKKRIVDKYFPKDYEQLIYVEPFIGAGSVYFYKEPSTKEIINDLDKNIVMLLKGFKKYDGNRISKDLNGFYTKEDFEKIKNTTPTDPYKKFIRLLFLIKHSFFGQMTSYSKPRSKKGIQSDYGNKFNERMKKTTILNKNFKEIISKYDSPETFFYLDPPYENSEGLYTHDELPIKDVYECLKNIKGRFLISYNDSKDAKKIFKGYNISYIKTKYSNPSEGSQLRPIKEMIIRNYE
jgi:DNA adenine methylase